MKLFFRCHWRCYFSLELVLLKRREVAVTFPCNGSVTFIKKLRCDWVKRGASVKFNASVMSRLVTPVDGAEPCRPGGIIDCAAASVTDTLDCYTVIAQWKQYNKLPADRTVRGDCERVYRHPMAAVPSRSAQARGHQFHCGTQCGTRGLGIPSLLLVTEKKSNWSKARDIFYNRPVLDSTMPTWRWKHHYQLLSQIIPLDEVCEALICHTCNMSP